MCAGYLGSTLSSGNFSPTQQKLGLWRRGFESRKVHVTQYKKRGGRRHGFESRERHSRFRPFRSSSGGARKALRSRSRRGQRAPKLYRKQWIPEIAKINPAAGARANSDTCGHGGSDAVVVIKSVRKKCVLRLARVSTCGVGVIPKLRLLYV